ncbi:MAG: DUF2628 domain-containing protein [Acetobacteraceae bacterium]|jgi:hypothetical protein|nr:DUF2628 domain-containing protein [Acetobacteraceae bacterium]
MKVWTVHAKGVAAPRLVKEGFSFWAFLFAVPWFLWHRMWLVTVLYIAGWTIFGVATADVPEEITGPVVLAGQLLIGWHARDLHRWTLGRRGWRMIGVVSSDGGEDAAVARLYTQRPELLAWVKAA